MNWTNCSIVWRSLSNRGERLSQIMLRTGEPPLTQLNQVKERQVDRWTHSHGAGPTPDAGRSTQGRVRLQQPGEAPHKDQREGQQKEEHQADDRGPHALAGEHG